MTPPPASVWILTLAFVGVALGGFVGYLVMFGFPDGLFLVHRGIGT